MMRMQSEPVSPENAGVKSLSGYYFLNLGFHGLHLSVIAFTLFGWALKETRLANLILILLTLGSWYILGIWHGDGYCPITSWHWKIRRRMGIANIPDSYIKLVLDGVSGKDLNSDRVNMATLVGTLVSGAISLVMNVHDWI